MQPTILIVEDDKELSEMYKLKFTNAKYTVFCQPDAIAALKWLQKYTPDCAIVDILLPGMNGLQLIKTMRKNTKLNRTKIVILTNLTATDVNMHSTVRESLGVVGYFVKSQITPAQLVDNIGMILEDKRSQ